MTPEFTLLFDSECPICRREANWLSRRNRGRLALVDIARPGFDPAVYGLTRGEVIAELCGIRADGTVTKGMESMRRAWNAVGWGWLIAPTGWPLVKLIFDAGYRVFARYRIPLGNALGRCEKGTCSTR